MDFFIELKKEYFLENLKNIEQMINTKIAPVLKANAYGHGSREIISLLNDFCTHIEAICVAYLSEAEQAWKDGWKKKIIIMSPNFTISENQYFEYFLLSFDFLYYLLRRLKDQNIVCKVHIKVNLGMNRFGFLPSEIDKLLFLLNENKNIIQVVGVCTHFPRINYEMTCELERNLEIFKKIVLKIKLLFPWALVHPFASKGINLIHKSLVSPDFVRVGGALYGLINNTQKKTLKIDFPEISLKQIMTLKVLVNGIFSVKAGEYIGYGNKCILKEDKVVAIVCFGYGFGYNNLLNDIGAAAYANNHFFSIIGLICMNNIIFDISHAVQSVKVGDYFLLTSNEYEGLKAAELSNRFLGGREYYFTSLLSFLIPKVIL